MADSGFVADRCRHISAAWRHRGRRIRYPARVGCVAASAGVWRMTVAVSATGSPPLTCGVADVADVADFPGGWGAVPRPGVREVFRVVAFGNPEGVRMPRGLIGLLAGVTYWLSSLASIRELSGLSSTSPQGASSRSSSISRMTAVGMRSAPQNTLSRRSVSSRTPREASSLSWAALTSSRQAARARVGQSSPAASATASRGSHTSPAGR